MAKRFIDTKIWDKSWFRKLEPRGKLIWIYVLTKCDHAGILDGDWEAASFFIGEEIKSERDLPQSIRDKMHRIDEDQYFISSFVDYQYGLLKESSKPHMSVIKRLKAKGLDNYIKTVPGTVKDKDIDKRKDKFIEKYKEIVIQKKYSDDEINNFISYWTEPNVSNTKMRFELQPTFDIKRRLNKWIKNSKEWKTDKENHERKEMHFTRG
jgi:hypothetical protein